MFFSKKPNKFEGQIYLFTLNYDYLCAKIE